jgi:hypothetical protein
MKILEVPIMQFEQGDFVRSSGGVGIVQDCRINYKQDDVTTLLVFDYGIVELIYKNSTEEFTSGVRYEEDIFSCYIIRREDYENN